MVAKLKLKCGRLRSVTIWNPPLVRVVGSKDLLLKLTLHPRPYHSPDLGPNYLVADSWRIPRERSFSEWDNSLQGASAIEAVESTLKYPGVEYEMVKLEFTLNLTKCSQKGRNRNVKWFFLSPSHRLGVAPPLK